MEPESIYSTPALTVSSIEGQPAFTASCFRADDSDLRQLTRSMCLGSMTTRTRSSMLTISMGSLLNATLASLLIWITRPVRDCSQTGANASI